MITARWIVGEPFTIEYEDCTLPQVTATIRGFSATFTGYYLDYGVRLRHIPQLGHARHQARDGGLSQEQGSSCESFYIVKFYFQ